MNELITLSPSVELTPTGLIFQNGLSFDEWQSVGLKLKAVRGMVHWWIGDWLNYGEERWGEMYTQALEETPYAYQTLMNDKFVASRVPSSRRREKLSWSHHADVAGLEPTEQDTLLDRAELLSLNRDAFRDEVTRHKDFPNVRKSFAALADELLRNRDQLTPAQVAAAEAVKQAYTQEG